MNCSLSGLQQQQFYAKVFKDLSVITDKKTPYNLKDYINQFYEQVVAASNDTSLGLTYIQLLPRIIATIVNKNPNIRKHFRDNQISTDDVLDLRDSFEDIAAVEKYLAVKELSPEKIEEIRKKAGIVGSQLERGAQSSVDLEFQAKHTTGFVTTGQEEEIDDAGVPTGEADPDPEKIGTYALMRSILDRLDSQNFETAEKIVIEASNGTVVKGIYLIPTDVVLSKGRTITQLTFATLTRDGYKKLFINERGRITNIEGQDQAEGSFNPTIDFFTPNTIDGKRDFIFKETGETSLAPIDELVDRIIEKAAINGLEIPDPVILKKELEEKRKKEVELVDKFVKTYISDKTAKLPLNIVGGRKGFILKSDDGIKLSEISNATTDKISDIEFDKFGRTYLKFGKFGEIVQVFPEKTSAELSKNIAKLITDSKVPVNVKFGILENIYNINDANFSITYNNTSKKPSMIIFSDKDEVYNSDNSDLADEDFIAEVLRNVFINISKNNINGTIIIPNYSSGKLVKNKVEYNNFVRQNSRVYTVLRNDGTIKSFNASLQYEFTIDALEQMYPTEKSLETAEVKEGVSELFDSNPELANAVYEAAGFKQTITQDDKSYYRGQIEEPTIDKDGNLVLYAREDELYKRAGLPSKGVSMTDDLQSAIEYGNGQLEVAQNILEEEYGYDVLGYDFENKIREIQDNGYYLIQIPKDISNEVVKEAGEVKIVGDKIVVPKGKFKIEQVIDGVETQITPQQKQQAQQLYSQYLDTIFPDSKVKDIVYHGANEPIEGDKFAVRPGATGNAIWFSGSKRYATNVMNRAPQPESLSGRKLRGDATMYSVLLNIKNPAYFYESSGAILAQSPERFLEGQIEPYRLHGNKQYDKNANDGALFHHPNSKKPASSDSADQVVVFEPKQIHILGNKQDIKDFKKFVKESSKEVAKVKAKPKTIIKNQNVNTTPSGFKGELNMDLINDINKSLKRAGFKPVNTTPEEIKKIKNWYESLEVMVDGNKVKLSTLIPVNEATALTNSDALGLFTSSGITLFTKAGNKDYTTLYHEAWHAFSQLLLTPEQKQSLYNSVRKGVSYLATATDKQVEEYLAEDFRGYVLSDGKKILIKPNENIFQKLWRIIKTFFTGQTDIVEPTVVPLVKELYDNLRLGNLFEYKYSVENMQFGNLYRGIEPITEEDPGISLSDSRLINESIDGAFSEIIDRTGLNVSAIYTDPRALEFLYNSTKQYFQQILDETIERVENDPDGVDTIDRNNIKILQYAIDNFGDYRGVVSGKQKAGVIAYHRQKSKYLAFEAKVLDPEEDKSDPGVDAFDRTGNDKSLKELASKQALYMVKSLYQVKANGEPIKNRLGFNKLVEFGKTWSTISKALINSNTFDEIYNKLIELQSSLPEVTQLLTKLGDPSDSQSSNANFKRWLGFTQTFNKTVNPIIQHRLSSVKDEDTESIRVSTFVQRATSDTVKIVNSFKSKFLTSKSKYLIRKKGSLPVLNINKVLEDFSSINRYNAFNFLNAVGFYLDNNPTLKAALEDAILDRKSKDTYIDLNYFIEALEKAKENKIIITDPIKFFRDPKQGNQSGAVNKILAIQARYTSSDFNTGIVNAEGNVEYETSLRNSLSQIIDGLNKITNLNQVLEDPEFEYLKVYHPLINPYAKHSYIINSLFDENGEKRKDVIVNLQNLSGITRDIDGITIEGIKTNKLNKYDKFLFDIHAIILGHAPELPRHASKSSAYGLSVNKYYGETSVNSLILPIKDVARYGHESAVPIILNYLSAELERIWYVKNIPSLKNVDSLKKSGDKIIAFDSVLSGPTKAKLYELVDNAKSIDDIVYSEELQKAIAKDSREYFNTQIKNNYKIWTKISSVTGSVLLSPEIRSKIAEETRIGKGLDKTNRFAVNAQDQLELINEVYTYNSWFNNFETQLFYGDASQFNHAKEEFHKRNASIASTGDFAILDNYTIDYLNNTSNNTYAEKEGLPKLRFDRNVKTTVLNDVEPESVYYTHYKKLLSDFGVSEERAEKILKPYKKITEGDGQGWITFDFYRNFLRSLNKWSDAQEELYNQVINDPNSIDPKKVYEFFPVLKASYYGPLKTEKLNVSGLHKFSLIPLIPSVIKDTNLEQFHKQLLEQGISYALYKSGSKISNITLEDGTIPSMYVDPKKRELYTGEYPINGINLNFFKNQLDIAPYFKGSVTLASQLRTIIETNLYENGKPLKKEYESIIKNYENSINRYVEFYKQKLFKEVGLEFNVEGKLIKGDPKDLIKAIQKELIRLEVPEHQMDILDVNEDGSLKYDFDSIINSNAIEKQLVAIVERKIVRPKVKGEQLVQVSGSGFENPKFTNPSKEDLLKYGTNGLAFYNIVDGNISPMQVKIALQGDFLKLLTTTHTDGKKVGTIDRLNEMLKDEIWRSKNVSAIRMIGVRIPVQGLNSIEYMEVGEFLPAEAGSIVIVPTELVAKSGGDFDIDKLSILMPNIKVKTEELETLAAEYPELDLSYIIEKNATITTDDQTLIDIENNILKSMISIMQIKENFVQLITPNETDIVKPIADDLAKYNREYNPKVKTKFQDPSFTTISPTRIFETEYNLYKHESNNIGKLTLGIGAVSNKYSVILNRVGAYLNENYNFLDSKGKVVKAKNRILFKHNKIEGNKISLSNLNFKDSAIYISDVISQLMNGWVDIEKDAWVFDMNAIYELTPTLLYMLQAGVDVETAAYFLSQPLIRDYIGTYRVLTGMYTKSLDDSDDSAKGIGFLKFKAKNYVLNKYGFFDADHKRELKKKISDNFLNKVLFNTNTLKNPIGSRKSIPSSVDLMMKAYNIYAISDNNIKDIVRNYDTRSPLAKLAFLHFLEIEDQAKVMREISSSTNVDTKKSGNLFQAKSRISKLEELEGGNSLPKEVAIKIETESPISAFFIQDYILNVFMDYFPLRASDKINTYLSDIVNNNYNDIYEAYGDVDTFIDLFRNDLLQFIIQNSIGSVDINTIANYKGYAVNDSIDVEKVKGLKRSAVYYEGKIYIDRVKLREEYNNKTYSKAAYEETGLAKLPADKRTDVVPLFSSEKQYAAFVLEREYLRATREQGSFTDDIYEQGLVEDALHNVYNLKSMFFGTNSFPDKYEFIKNLLETSNYTLFDYLVYDSQQIKTGTKNAIIKNLRLIGDTKDADFLEDMNAQFEELSDINVEKNPDPIINREISEFFNKLSIFGFMQSGMNKSYLSFVPILSSRNFKDIINTNISEFSKVLESEKGNTALYRYYTKFNEQNSRNNTTKYRFKNYVVDNTISKMGNEIPKLPEGTSSTLTPRVYTYKYTKAATVGLINKYSEIVGVYSAAKDGTGTNMLNTDTYLGNASKIKGTTIGLPIFESFVGKPKYLDYANHADNMKLVEDVITHLKELYDNGKTLLFNTEGYGILDENLNIDSIAYAQLFKELYYNFGYLNPVFAKDPKFMEYIYSVQPINQAFDAEDSAPDTQDDVVEEKEISLIDGKVYPVSAINSQMLEEMGYDEDGISDILEEACKK